MTVYLRQRLRLARLDVERSWHLIDLGLTWAGRQWSSFYFSGTKLTGTRCRAHAVACIGVCFVPLPPFI